MIPYQASVDFLDALLQGHLVAGSLKIKLAKNNPAHADTAVVLADLTECDFPGYADFGTVGNLPSPPTLNGSNEAESDSPTLTWTRSSTGTAQTAYGLYITFTDSVSGARLFAWSRFGTPIVVTAGGDVIVKKVNLYAWNGVP